ncbi:MAG: FHA domain-containing protein [Planctomycetes bacterium]|nr:FHA domain-containing protein [Planctomycetota bacterium]
MSQVIIKRKDHDDVIQLKRKVTSFGRTPQNDVILKGDRISRRHCEVRKTSEGYSLVDLESRNGTFVNGERVKEKKLELGDRIHVGDVLVIFENELPPALVSGAPAARPTAEDDFIVAGRKKVGAGWIWFGVVIVVLGGFIWWRLSERAGKNSVTNSPSGNMTPVQTDPDSLPTGSTRISPDGDLIDINLVAKLERLLQQARDREKNNELAKAISFYEVISEKADQDSMIWSLARSRLKKIKSQAESELELCRNLLKEAELTGQAEIYRTVIKRCGLIVQSYQGTVFVKSAQEIINQARESLQKDSAVLREETASRLLVLAAGYRQEGKWDLARSFYNKIIAEFTETLVAPQARQALNELKSN